MATIGFAMSAFLLSTLLSFEFYRFALVGAQHCLAASAAVGGDTDGATAQRPAKLLQRDVVKELALLVADHDPARPAGHCAVCRCTA